MTRRLPQMLLTLACLLLLQVSAASAAPTVTDCKGALEPSIYNGCDGVSFVGCCDALGRQLWCQGDHLYCVDCNDGFPACGWNSFGYYDCGQEAGLSDPSGEHPLSCSACPAACADAPCSAECAGTCGACDGDGICMDDGTCYTPQCEGKQCGNDPLGFSCGVCPQGTECLEQVGQCLPLPKGCAANLEGPGCDGCVCEACVCALYPSCCTDNWDLFCASACETQCEMDCSACPAEPSCGELECGEFCGVDCGTCAEGQTCQSGTCCEPQCDGKECGSDGCGGVCGECEAFGSCQAGQCLACVPQCEGKDCGDDGCGGTCGECGDGTFCAAGGQCSSSYCAGRCGDTNVNCGPSCNCFCDIECFDYNDCCDGVCEVCAESYPDRCCEPSCGDKQCGGDGCGGSCGDCEQGSICEEGMCVECEPACEGKTCGDDGCGGSCGGCDQGFQCGEEGTCVPCVPDCEGKTCGDDGCGGICAECPYGTECDDGSCEPKGSGCGNVEWIGCCHEGELYYCDNGALKNQSCSDSSCGWNPQANQGNGWYDCDFEGADPSGEHPMACWEICTPSCVGKACGDNGCGGSCGVCEEGWDCEGFQCMPPCEPDCADRDCGMDGCGGVCGVCYPGEGCNDLGKCSPGCSAKCDGATCGADGCGGSCGMCSPGDLCDTTGNCRQVEGCVGIPETGICQGSVVVFCEDGSLNSFDCLTVEKACIEVPGYQALCVDTVPPCEPQCDGRECGNDLCGGSCGVCEDGFSCQASQCEPVATGDELGADATGGGGDGDNPWADDPEEEGKSTTSSGCGATPGSSAPLWLLSLGLLLARRRRTA